MEFAVRFNSYLSTGIVSSKLTFFNENIQKSYIWNNSKCFHLFHKFLERFKSEDIDLINVAIKFYFFF